jgi:hypothetical protein
MHRTEGKLNDLAATGRPRRGTRMAGWALLILGVLLALGSAAAEWVVGPRTLGFWAGGLVAAGFLLLFVSLAREPYAEWKGSRYREGIRGPNPTRDEGNPDLGDGGNNTHPGAFLCVRSLGPVAPVRSPEWAHGA